MGKEAKYVVRLADSERQSLQELLAGKRVAADKCTIAEWAPHFLHHSSQPAWPALIPAMRPPRPVIPRSTNPSSGIWK